MTVYIGIDPGLNGAVCFLDDDASSVLDTPVFDSKPREYDVVEMAAILRRGCGDGPAVAALEVSRGKPGAGSANTYYRQGYGVGLWEGILAALGISYEIVRPQTWKPGVGVPKKSEKSASLAIAKRAHPQFANKLLRKKDNGRADAILIAEWRRRQDHPFVRPRTTPQRLALEMMEND